MKSQLKLYLGIAIAGVAIPLLTACSAQAAGLLIADGGFGGVLGDQGATVDVTINNGIAVTQRRPDLRQHREPPGRSALHLPGAQGRLRRQLQHVDQRQGDGRRSRREGTRPPNLRQLQADTRAIRACSSRSTTRFEMRIFPIGRRRTARPGSPTTRNSTSTTTGRPTSIRWPPRPAIHRRTVQRRRSRSRLT